MSDAGSTLLVFMNARGDHLLNLPAVRAISGLFDGQLQLVCREGFRDTYFADVEFTNVCAPRTTCTNLQYVFDPVSVAYQVGPVDAVFCLNPARSDSMEQLLAILDPPTSVGFDEAYRTSLPLDFTKHSADLAFDLARHLDPSLSIERYAAPPALPKQATRLSETIRGCLPDGAQVAVVHADSKPDKMWPIERFRAMLQLLLEQDSSLHVLDVGLRNWRLDLIPSGNRVVWCGQLAMAEAMSLMMIADLFVGVDSCFLHAADLFRVPGVGLFGPTHAAEFGFRFGPHRHVAGGSTMAELTVDQVMAEVQSVRRSAELRRMRPGRVTDEGVGHVG